MQRKSITCHADNWVGDGNWVSHPTPGFVDDVMFAHNQRFKGDANRAYIQRLTRGSDWGEV